MILQILFTDYQQLTTYNIQINITNKYKLSKQVLTSNKNLICIENLISRSFNISSQQALNDLDNKQKD